MNYDYQIVGADMLQVLREPTVGKWYVGIEYVLNAFGENTGLYCGGGVLAQYIGQGEFVTDERPPSDWSDDSYINMGDYEYLVEQG